ncbi:hypothetical protein TRSC58_07416 [Trypanosoma rangeli SC58]|uniref:Uncharacterized protein n=1 Tax=Trypanosoma rangeli SC58 TaxID=429131 RepID=A0A061IRM3_TRYRA|nr:hypothetical protein TRSC58_07416 [Trypanosoma rangeli SC58]
MRVSASSNRKPTPHKKRAIYIYIYKQRERKKERDIHNRPFVYSPRFFITFLTRHKKKCGKKAKKKSPDLHFPSLFFVLFLQLRMSAPHLFNAAETSFLPSTPQGTHHRLSTQIPPPRGAPCSPHRRCTRTPRWRLLHRPAALRAPPSSPSPAPPPQFPTLQRMPKPSPSPSPPPVPSPPAPHVVFFPDTVDGPRRPSRPAVWRIPAAAARKFHCGTRGLP